MGVEKALVKGGPKTPTGKARAARNAIRHGLTATTTLLDHEDESELAALREGIFASLEPASMLEEVVAERVVQHAWRLRRYGRVETEAMLDGLEDPVCAYMGRSTPDAAIGRTINQNDVLEKLARYETTTERAFFRCLHEFWSLRMRRDASEEGRT